MLPIRVLPVLERWDCSGCGRCCRGSLIRLSPEDLARLRGQRWEDRPEFAGRPVVVREGWWSPTYRLAQQADGSCVFLTSDGRCRIHQEFGGAAKPLFCQMYPWQLVPRAHFAILTTRRSCPAAAADQGTELKEQLAEVRRLAAVGQLLEESPRPPLLTRRRQVDWEDWSRVARALEELVVDPRYPLVRRIVHGLRFCDLLERSRLERFDGARLGELCDLLRENATDVDEVFADRRPPERTVATLFRQTAIEYLRLHPVYSPRSSSWRERWRLGRLAWKFARGHGPVPPLHPTLPSVEFADLEQPLGHWSTEQQRPLNRFFETHAGSWQYAIASRPGWSLVENFRALALTFPVCLWLLRYVTWGRPFNATDVADLVGALERGQGYAPLAARQHRSRLRVLAYLHGIEALAAWYAR